MYFAMKKSGLSLFFMALVMGSMSVLSTDLSEGKSGCSSCHNTDHAAELSDPAYYKGPQLGGFDSNYILEQLVSFKEGRRGTGLAAAEAMRSAVKGLTGEQLRPLAKWAAGLEGEKAFNYQSAKEYAGYDIYVEKCKGCHNGFIGRAMTGSPRLDYLDSNYLLQQLNYFDQDLRKFDHPNKHQRKMQAVVKGLTVREFAELTDFFHGATAGVHE